MSSADMIKFRIRNGFVMTVLFHSDSWFGMVSVKISLFAFAAQSSIAYNQSDFDLEVFDSMLATRDR
jgi:hypothetical protein